MDELYEDDFDEEDDRDPLSEDVPAMLEVAMPRLQRNPRLHTAAIYHEPPKARIALSVWFQCNRNFSAAARKLKVMAASGEEVEAVSAATLKNWADKFNWEARAKNLAAQLDEKIAGRDQRRQREVVDRAQRLGELMVDRATTYFEQLDPARMRPQDAVQLARVGVATERQAAGLPEWVSEVAGRTDDEIISRLRQLQALHDGGAIGVDAGSETAWAGDTGGRIHPDPGDEGEGGEGPPAPPPRLFP